MSAPMLTPVPGPLTTPRWKDESKGTFSPEKVAAEAKVKGKSKKVKIHVKNKKF